MVFRLITFDESSILEAANDSQVNKYVPFLLDITEMLFPVNVELGTNHQWISVVQLFTALLDDFESHQCRS